jgi:hypothetical protein
MRIAYSPLKCLHLTIVIGRGKRALTPHPPLLSLPKDSLNITALNLRELSRNIVFLNSYCACSVCLILPSTAHREHHISTEARRKPFN